MLNEIIQAVRDAEAYGLMSNTANEVLTGLSGDKLVGALQRLSALFHNKHNTCYLEVGVFQGLTLLSVANACPGLECYGIDNFAQFDPQSKNFGLVKERMTRLSLTNASVINRDYEDALEKLNAEIGENKVGVYFVDGPHDYRSQLMCLELVLPHLHENAVIVIDDCNYNHVRQANRDFLVTHPEYKLVYEAYTKCHPVNMSNVEVEETRRGWWNGVNIIVRDIDNDVCPMYPSTERKRTLYENEHAVHASRIAEVSPQAIAVVQSLYELNFAELIRNLYRFYRDAKQYQGKFRSRYSIVNTHSAELPVSNYNTSVSERIVSTP